MSNNNDANAEANDNNNEVQGRENLENQPPQQLQHHNHNNIQQLPQPAHGHPLDHDPLNNQNNPPEWAAFPDLLRVQEPQQNGGGGVVVAGDIVVGGPGLMGNPLVLQRAGVANPPDVSLPGAAGRDPPPPDFDIDRMGALHNQRLPDMALDADQAQGQAAAAAQHSLPDMALDASGAHAGAHARASGSHCGGARLRPRRSPGSHDLRIEPRGSPMGMNTNQQHLPGSLARMAQAVAISGGVQTVDNNGVLIGPIAAGNQTYPVDILTNRLMDLEAQVANLHQQMLERDRHRVEQSARVLDELTALRRSVEASNYAGRERDHASLENRLINMESLIQRLAQGPPVALGPQQQAVPEDVLATLRSEERRRQRRETERLARTLAASLHVAVEHFIDMLNQEDDDNGRRHEDDSR
ncbi:uncharacterized protein LOC111266959 isoform X2 [Varroa jacobsoni]|nr:uncharacterized protein LOC111266959 isoform X2 [Varroa jacobsoni]XP_022700585.1 uncharacterized protein LOC111266959 isoform X2 [Varroa jacobsoni]XP_022700587.1 uncharacterized protein LOC111266959 isoform X2 [Varroa jacobsoni]XP_022700588.1 uncharacterized protein LOC111266959 isoform X2 [Varroa jacobsoni]